MIVVSDTTPINHLILIDEVHILQPLFESVFIPEEVFNELQAENTPLKVKAFMLSRPEWMQVRNAPIAFDNELEELDAGEKASIALAEELNAERVLMDEKAGRTVAVNRGLHVIGTLGILFRAAELGLLDFKKTLDKLKSNGFYVSVQLETFFLKKDAERRSSQT